MNTTQKIKVAELFRTMTCFVKRRVIALAISGFLIACIGLLIIYNTDSLADTVTYSILLIFASLLWWLSNCEIKKSLERARLSERALASERDLLEMKIAERTCQLRHAQAERMAEISHIAKFGELSQGLFHDLMTPLSSVALYMEKLESLDMPETAEARAYLDKAVLASHKMGDFMKSIRGYIKHNNVTKCAMTKNTCSNSKEKISLQMELHTVLRLLKYRARTSNVIIRTRKNADILCVGDPMHFERIFMNLISNAIEAHETTYAVCAIENVEEKYVDIDMRTLNNMNEIIVSDNGPGISSEHIEKIFEPFFSTKPTDKSIGVGLSTVRNIVENELHGTVRAESTLGKGSRFIISFPV